MPAAPSGLCTAAANKEYAFAAFTMTSQLDAGSLWHASDALPMTLTHYVIMVPKYREPFT